MVCQSITSGAVLFTNHTSAVKGFLPPNGIPKRFLINGIFSVVRVCFPGPNFPTICPFENKMASWLSRTTSCVAVLIKYCQLCFYFCLFPTFIAAMQATGNAVITKRTAIIPLIVVKVFARPISSCSGAVRMTVQPVVSIVA